MIVPLLAVALVAIVVVAGAIRLALDDGAARALAVLTGVVLLGIGVLVAGLVVGGGGGEDDGDDHPAANAVEEEPSGPGPLQRPTVRLLATDPDALPRVPPTVGDLEPGQSVVLGVSGLEPGSTATVHQCPAGASQASSCRAGLPLRASDVGQATVLVDLEDRFDVGFGGGDAVDCETEACSVVVFGTARLEAVTVFGRPAPPPATVRTDPAAVPPGATLTATAEGLPPGAQASFSVCRPGGGATADCSSPTPAGLVGSDGRARADVVVGAGRCPRGGSCSVAVMVDDDGDVRAFARLYLVGRTGPGYDDARLAIGLAVAGVLLLAALVLLRTTNWTPVDGDPFAGVVIPKDPFADVTDR